MVHLEDEDFQSYFDGLLEPKDEISFLRHIASCRLCQKRFLEYSSLFSSLKQNAEESLVGESKVTFDLMTEVERSVVERVFLAGLEDKANTWLQVLKWNPFFASLSKELRQMQSGVRKGFSFFLERLKRRMLESSQNGLLIRLLGDRVSRANASKGMYYKKTMRGLNMVLAPPRGIKRLKDASFSEVLTFARKVRCLAAWVR